MSNFKQFLVEYYNLQEQIRDQFHPENNVYRLDQTPIKNFQPRHFDHNDDWSESGHVQNPHEPVESGYKRTQGLFAGELHRVAPYAAMHNRGMQWLRHEDENGNPIVVFNKNDKHAIENHTSHLSAFPKHDFHVAGDSGEHFKATTHDTVPVYQKKVNPIHLLHQTGHTIKFVDDVNHYAKSLQHDYEGENL